MDQRSKKANAFSLVFSRNKKVVLYDTLIKNHTADELVAMLAHEIGHYKLNHVKTNMVISIITTGFMLFILSNFIFNSDISYALGGNVSFRHLEILLFIIYSPISSIISVLMNIIKVERMSMRQTSMQLKILREGTNGGCTEKTF